MLASVMRRRDLVRVVNGTQHATGVTRGDEGARFPRSSRPGWRHRDATWPEGGGARLAHLCALFFFSLSRLGGREEGRGPQRKRRA